MNIPKSALSIVLAVGLLGVAGCSSSSEDSAAPESTPEMAQSTSPEAMGSMETTAPAMDESQAAEEVVITIKDFKFEGPDSIAPGATVTVINKDSAAHTVTSEEEGLFDTEVEADSTVTFTAPEEAGDYAYVCTYHPNMTGTLVVK